MNRRKFICSSVASLAVRQWQRDAKQRIAKLKAMPADQKTWHYSSGGTIYPRGREEVGRDGITRYIYREGPGYICFFQAGPQDA